MGARNGIRLDAIRELLRSLIAAGETEKAIDQAMLIITQQAERLDRLLRERYGVKSEKVSPEQLRLALAELAREDEVEPPAAPPEPPSDEPAVAPVKAKRPATRRPLPPTQAPSCPTWARLLVFSKPMESSRGVLGIGTTNYGRIKPCNLAHLALLAGCRGLREMQG